MTAKDLAVFLIAGVTIRKPGRKEANEAEEAEERTSGPLPAAATVRGLTGRASLHAAGVCRAAPPACCPNLGTKYIDPS